MDDDWGLQAVVRGCSAAVSATGASISAATAPTRTSFVSDFDFQSFNNNNNTTTTTTTTNSNNSSFLLSSSSSSSFGNNNNNSQSSVGCGQLFSLSDPIASMRPQRLTNIGYNNNRVVVEDLHDLYKPFFVPKPEPKSLTISHPNTTIAPSHSNTNTNTNTNHNHNHNNNNSNIIHNDPTKPIKQIHNNNAKLSSSSNKQSHAGSGSSSTTTRSKKRKNQMKKVCQVPAESLSADIWAWRKYGQKPIKGSPYPRGYYRCSSSKGCLARKQVERNRSDPAMFIVTYTCEHNHPAPTHRNSLAGSTRQKPSLTDPTDPTKPSLADPTKPSSPATSPDDDLAASAPSGSAEGPESSTAVMDEDDDDDEFGLSDVALSDDFFVGLEGLEAPTVSGEFSSDNFPASFALPWAAAAAAAGRS